VCDLRCRNHESRFFISCTKICVARKVSPALWVRAREDRRDTIKLALCRGDRDGPTSANMNRMSGCNCLVRTRGPWLNCPLGMLVHAPFGWFACDGMEDCAEVPHCGKLRRD
jgi:hypothetical protein